MQNGADEAKWHTYYMGIARAAALKSKDPKTKVGAVIVKDNRIISVGFNGMPAGFPETDELWASDAKHNFVIHAEVNALLYAHTGLSGATLYTTLYPCLNCAKAICAARINLLVFADDKSYDRTTEHLLEGSQVKIIHVKGV